MSDSNSHLLKDRSEIASAYVEHSSVNTSELSKLVKDVLNSIQQSSSSSPETSQIRSKLPVPIKNSVTDNYIICLEDGKKLKSLKGHLRSNYGLTPEQYKLKWNLPNDYPMDAACVEREQMEIFDGLLKKRSNLYRKLATQ